MKSFSFGKALVLGSMLCFVVPVACGDDETNPAKGGGAGDNGGGEGPSGKAGSDNGTAGSDMTGEGGAGGAAALPPGLSNESKTIECGGDCKSSFVGISPAMGVFIDPCCDASDACGLSTTFLAAVGTPFPGTTCLAHEQEGELDEACPTPEPVSYPASDTLMIPLDPFPGCCRADTGTCGVQVNALSTSAFGAPTPLGDLKLGCIDSAPFFNGTPGAKCGAGMGGAGGAGGAGSGDNGTGGASGGAGGAG